MLEPFDGNGMSARTPPLGYRLLAVVSLLIGLGGLSLAVGDGRLGSLVLALAFLPAAYGLWTGAEWGGTAGIVAFGPVGGTVTVLRASGDVVGVALSLVVAAAVVGYLLNRERGRGHAGSPLAP